jgi:hypothetical protein
MSPFRAKFGSFDAEFFRFPSDMPLSDLAPKHLKALDEDLKAVREIMARNQEAKVVKRRGGRTRELTNIYQPGDRVLWDSHQRIPKLSAQYNGPYTVILQSSNDVTCRHMCTHVVKPLHVSRLKIFHGSEEEALRLARLDYEQHVIDKITGYCGDPARRTTCEFEVLFQDGEVLWATWEPDITSTQAFEEFCNSKPHLRILLKTALVAKKYISDINKTRITAVVPGSKVFLDLRFWPSWFFHLDKKLDVFHTTYVVELVYQQWIGSGAKKIHAKVHLFREELVCDHYFVVAFGSVSVFPTDAVLVDEAFATKHPFILDREEDLRSLHVSFGA